MINVSNVTKKYGKVTANDNISLQIKEGEIGVLLGPNGAGKSTLIKSIAGLLRFEGEITIGGYNNRTKEAKSILGYVPELPALYPMLTVYEHLELMARAYRLQGWQEKAQALLTRFEMDDKTKKLGKELSKGMQQKVSLCCAMMIEPKALILDEPMVGMDPHGIRELKLLLKETKEKGCAMLISTHIIESMEDNWDTTYIMKDASIVNACRYDDLKKGQSLEEMFFTLTEQGGN